MTSINLRNWQVQNNIEKVEDAFEPLYKVIAHKVVKDYGVIKGEWTFDYQMTSTGNLKHPHEICLDFSAFNEKVRNAVCLYVYVDPDDMSREIKIVDANATKASDNTGYSDSDSFALIDNSAYESDINGASNRKSNFITFLTELKNANTFAMDDYVNEIISRFNYRLNNTWKEIDTSNCLEVELANTHSSENKWFALPINESNPETHYWLTSGYVVDYRGNIMIRPDDDLHELNKLAKFMQKHDIHNTATMYAYVQENKPELLSNQIYRYTDDNLNKALDKMTPAQIVKNTHADSWNLSDPFATNEADYFMVKDGVIKLMDKTKAENMINKNMTTVFGAFCKMADVKLNSDRHKKPYWL